MSVLTISITYGIGAAGVFLGNYFWTPPTVERVEHSLGNFSGALVIASLWPAFVIAKLTQILMTKAGS